MNKNNQSKEKFKEFISKYKLDRVDNHRNVCVLPNNKKYTFSVTSWDKIPQCRQLYSDTDGFITYMEAYNEYRLYNIADKSKYSISRISPNGNSAYNVILTKEEASDYNSVTSFCQ